MIKKFLAFKQKKESINAMNSKLNLKWKSPSEKTTAFECKIFEGNWIIESIIYVFSNAVYLYFEKSCD